METSTIIFIVIETIIILIGIAGVTEIICEAIKDIKKIDNEKREK